jgi:acetyl esterase
MAATTEIRVPDGHGGVRLRLYDPGPHGMKPAIVYLHGGGWTIFSLDTHDRLMREIAARAGAMVIGVDYALSPEAKYPVALEQVCTVLRHVAAHGQELGVEPSRFAVAGDSAGANLSVAACLRLRAAGGVPRPAAMALIYGVFDRRISEEAAARYGGAGYMLGAGEMEQFWRNYLTDESEADDPCVSPLRADLRALPPAFLVVPECDVLAEQSLRMARRLADAGVDVSHAVYKGASHSFLEAVSIAPLADRALGETAAWLRGALAPAVS